jgi:hypothetical protein
MYWQNCKSVCEQGDLQTWLSYTSSVRRNGPKLIQLIVGSLWKATRNIWPKLKLFKGNATKLNFRLQLYVATLYFGQHDDDDDEWWSDYKCPSIPSIKWNQA